MPKSRAVVGLEENKKTAFVSYRSLRALDVKSQAVIGKPPCRSVYQCQSKPFHQPTALYDTKEKTRKNRDQGFLLFFSFDVFVAVGACGLEVGVQRRLTRTQAHSDTEDAKQLP